MDISTDLSQTRLMNQVQTAVLVKSLDQTRQSGADLQKLMDSNAQPNTITDPMMGQNVNLLA
jgi:hypothetical protein